jgi:hypothetical protein
MRLHYLRGDVGQAQSVYERLTDRLQRAHRPRPRPSRGPCTRRPRRSSWTPCCAHPGWWAGVAR